MERTEDGAVLFRRSDGRRIELVPAAAWSGSVVVPQGVSGRSLRTWDGTPLNVGYAIDVLRPQPATWVSNPTMPVP